MASDINRLEIAASSKSTTSMLLAALTGFYFGFRLFIMLLSVRILGTDPRTGTALDLTVNYLILLLVLFSTIGESNLSLRRIMWLPALPWAILFLAFSCASFLWTSAASVATSAAYWFAMVADFAIVVMLMRSGPLVQVSDSLMKGYVWGASIVAAIAWIMPAQSDLRLGDDELLGANQIGYLCGFAFFFAQYLIQIRKEKLGVHAVLLGVTVLRSLSKTTIVALFLGEAFLLATDKSINRKTKLLITTAGLAAILVLWGVWSAYFADYTSTGDQSSTLTGRLGIWAYLLVEALQQPWFGHGFDSVWKVVPPFGPDQFEAAHAHNELLQQFYAYGIAGVCLFTGIYANLFRHIRRLKAQPLRTFLFAFLIFILVRGLADTERFDLSLPMWAVVIISLLVEERYQAGLENKMQSSQRHPRSISGVPSQQIG